MRGLVLAAVLCLGPATAALAAPAIVVESDRVQVDTVLGDSTVLDVRISNTGDQPTSPLLAHLVVIDPHTDRSADAEDWTDRLTRSIASVPPGESVDVSWDVQPISAGEFFVMIQVTSARAGLAAPAVSPTIVFTVDQPARLIEGPVLPVSIAVPLVVTALVVAGRRRERAQVERVLAAVGPAEGDQRR